MKKQETVESIMDIVHNITKPKEEVVVHLFEENIFDKTVRKGTILQRTGDKISRAYYVRKGLLRSYVVDAKGKEHTYVFAPEGWIITDVEMIANHTQAFLCVEALEDSEIEILDGNVYDRTLEMNIEILSREVGRLIKRINVLQKRIIMMMSATAEARYEDFLHTYPQVAQRVPQKMIASYLGITPEALSTIRKKRTEKKEKRMELQA